MATPKAQRIGIWIIAIALTIGTLGSFLVIVLSNENQKIDQAQQQKLQSDYNKEIADYQAKVDAQAKELSPKYYDEFSKYDSVPAKFDASSVKELTTKDLKVGDGETVKDGTSYSAYYIGWNPDGVIFDQSIDGDSLKAPLSSGKYIEGWNKGVIGMKIGGVRELTIPSDMAYGAAGSGDKIGPNTPIKFIIMLIPPVETILTPDLSKYYQ